MSELPHGIEPAVEPRPRDSASAIVLRTESEGGWRVLLGRRARSSRFMPGHYAFPGGGLEPADGKPAPAAFRRCASRELLEETGLRVGESAWLEAGERVTPPMFHVRFRTLFYVARDERATAGDRLEPLTPENESLVFVRPDEAVEGWSRGEVRVPPPVLPILRALAEVGDAPLSEIADRLVQVNGLEQRSPRIEFVPGVWMLPVKTATLPPATHTNCWMPGGSRFAIVDPGSDRAEELDRLMRVVARRREAGSTPWAVVLTHAHRDHTQGAVAVAAALGLSIRAHRRVLDAIGATGLERIEIVDGQRIDLGGSTMVALHTPGHAPGHLAFDLPESDALIAGDLVGGMSTILIDPDTGDMDDYLASLERANALGRAMLLPGHGPPLPGSRLGKLIEHRQRRERAILEALDGPSVDLERIARRAYVDVPRMPVRLTERQTLSHLLRLERGGRVRRDDGDERRWSKVSVAATGERPASGSSATAFERIERRLEKRFLPQHLRIRDDSARHAGHAGASSGGGHFKVTLVSAAFEGLSRLEQHRLVNETLADLLPDTIHALALTTRSPSEWT